MGILQRAGYSLESLDYHLMHRFCCLLAIGCRDFDRSWMLLSQLVDRKSYPLVSRFKITIAKKQVSGLPKRFSAATLGHHTVTSKYWAKRHKNFVAATTQIIPITESLGNFEYRHVPTDIVTRLTEHLLYELPEHVLHRMEAVIPDLSHFVKQMAKRILPIDPCKELQESLAGLSLRSLYVPRPSDMLNRQILSLTHETVRSVYFGHNLAYEPLLRSERQHRFFAALDPSQLNHLKYIDSLGAYKPGFIDQLLKWLRRPSTETVLFACFPYGDTGYNEYYSNDHFQRLFLSQFIETLYKTGNKGRVIFCVHPGTKDLNFVETALRGFDYVIGGFDSLLSRAALVIAPYRGTTCVASALASEVPLILLGDYELSTEYRARNLRVMRHEVAAGMICNMLAERV